MRHGTQKRKRRRKLLTMMITLTLISTCIVQAVHALECIQCDRQALWYSPEENERHIARCQRGLIPPTRCTNTSHTHCIYNYYKQGGVITVTERRCGTAEEASGCTLYKSLVARARRHLIAGARLDAWRDASGRDSPSAASVSNRRRDAGPLVVEVCAGGCTRDGCTSDAGAPARTHASVSTLTLATLALLFVRAATMRVIGVG